MTTINIKKSVYQRLEAYREKFKEKTGLSSPSYSDVLESLLSSNGDE